MAYFKLNEFNQVALRHRYTKRSMPDDLLNSLMRLAKHEAYCILIAETDNSITFEYNAVALLSLKAPYDGVLPIKKTKTVREKLEHNSMLIAKIIADLI